MVMLKAIALSCIILAAPTAAFAQTPQTGILYDCDTAADHFSELVLPAPSGGFVVSGQIQVNQVPEIGKYIPLARLSVAQPAAPGGSPSDQIGFKLTVMPAKMIDPKIKDDKLLVQFLNWDERTGGNNQEHPLFGMAHSGDKLPFTLTYGNGKVSVHIAGQDKDFPIRTDHPVVRLVCSTGEFLFTNLRIEASG
jgi:hypothetical protein